MDYLQGDQMGRFVAKRGDKMRSVAPFLSMKIDPFLGDKKGDFG